jgi:hypothetical protein
VCALFGSHTFGRELPLPRERVFLSHASFCVLVCGWCSREVFGARYFFTAVSSSVLHKLGPLLPSPLRFLLLVTPPPSPWQHVDMCFFCNSAAPSSVSLRRR